MGIFSYFSNIEVHAKDLVTIPQKTHQPAKRKAPAKVPDWHLTSSKTMDFITSSQERQIKRKENELKYYKIKKEAVKEAKKNERKTKTKAKK